MLGGREHFFSLSSENQHRFYSVYHYNFGSDPLHSMRECNTTSRHSHLPFRSNANPTLLKLMFYFLHIIKEMSWSGIGLAVVGFFLEIIRIYNVPLLVSFLVFSSFFFAWTYMKNDNTQTDNEKGITCL